MPLSLAVLVSGGGSNLQALIDRIEQGVLDAEIKLVVANKPDAYGLIRARKNGIPTKVVVHSDFPSRGDFDREVLRAIEAHQAEAVILAGFMRILSPGFVQAFHRRMLNIHPALLPSFPGAHGQRDAADYGVRISGCTVHFVDEIMDHGPVVIQAAVPAEPGEGGDALAARILKLEHRIFPQAVQWLAEGRLITEDRHVRLTPAKRPPADLSDLGVCLVNPPLEQGF
ncbi:phosphoribosylglycinamide formyltransferase [Desulfovibrio aminophilus]|uniref:phosphoribosylglycinamide formyltransferase n=1 Tax=Desulfovibrio aminophilus TaxID=81425 RepID=UPI0003FF87CD|nr:phosphoribosylglycinamide formyltransferase [Desulfovibrio aminophilus]